jgi:hypothetical protein
MNQLLSLCRTLQTNSHHVKALLRNRIEMMLEATAHCLLYRSRHARYIRIAKKQDSRSAFSFWEGFDIVEFQTIRLRVRIELDCLIEEALFLGVIKSQFCCRQGPQVQLATEEAEQGRNKQ